MNLDSRLYIEIERNHPTGSHANAPRTASGSSPLGGYWLILTSLNWGWKKAQIKIKKVWQSPDCMFFRSVALGLQKHSLKSEALSQVRLRRLRLLLRTALSPSLSACSSLRSATISCCWFCWACWSLVSSILCESTMRWFWEEYLRLNWRWIRGKVPCINVWKEQTKQKTWTTDIVFKNQLCKSSHVLVSSFWHSTSAWRRSILFTMYSRVNGSIPVAWASSLSLSWSADIAAVATILSTYGKPHRFTLMSIWQRPQNLIPKQKWYGKWYLVT